MVSKWFRRNKVDGSFSADLVMERGLYDVSILDVATAEQSIRGVDALADRGYELIENTFLIVNDITYVDHEENAKKASTVLNIIGAIAQQATGEQNNIVTAVAQLGSMVSDMIAGFTVNVTSYLYQLDWNDQVANTFYDAYYYDRPGQDSLSQAQFAADADLAAKKAAYEADRGTFKLKYVGEYKAKSAKPVLRGLHNPEDVFRKVCGRAIDENVAQLQKKFDQFKVKVPLISTEPLVAPIGMKEGVTAGSKFEVLMPVFDEATGKVKYNRKGIIKPEAGKIWDNRYMATEEQAEGADLSGTTFKLVSGTGITPGMLIRQIK